MSISQVIIPRAFTQLIVDLSHFKLNCAPFNEAEIQRGLAAFLLSKHYPVLEQVCNENGRFDLTVDGFVLEAKVTATMGIVEQLDRYSSSCDGLILICWRATKPLKKIFALAKAQAKIPIELIEIRRNCELV